MTENELRDHFVLRVPDVYPHVRVYVRNVLDVLAISERSGKHFRAHAGIKGQADLYAIVRGGRHIEIETKAHKHKWYAQQIAWRQFCIDFGIPYLALRAAKDEAPEQTVTRWLSELGDVLA